MSEYSAAASYQVILSHVELLFLLRLFGVEPTFGVDRDPLAGLPAEQVSVALDTASAALRARDLLRYDNDQQPLLADDLMGVLNAYAAPQQIISAYRYIVGDDLPLAFFGYLRHGSAVVHTRPADLLHEFALFNSASALAGALALFCAGAAPGALPHRRLAVPARAIAAARAYADAGQAPAVLQVLLEAGVSESNAQLLTDDLVTPTAVTAVTLLVQQPDAAPQRRDFIYWQSARSDSAMVIVEQGAEVLIADGSVESIATIVNELV